MVEQATDAVIEGALRQWKAARPAVISRRDALTKELRTVEREITKLESRLLEDDSWQVVAEALTARKQRRDGLRAELAQAEDDDGRSGDLTPSALRQRFAEKLTAWRKALASSDPQTARRALMATLAGERIVLEPLSGGRGCQISGRVAPLAGPGEIGRTPQSMRIPSRVSLMKSVIASGAQDEVERSGLALGAVPHAQDELALEDGIARVG